MNEKDIIQFIKKDKWMIKILKEVESLDLNDWWIGAGFVRSKVWDKLHKYRKSTPIPDIDIIYYDSNAEPGINEKEIWKKLKEKFPDIKWSVTNEAYRHLRLNRASYKSSTEALSEWVETATCIGVSIKGSKISITAPWGIDDLVNLKLKPTRLYRDKLDVFYDRLEKKEWLSKWPKLKVEI
jgi:hypothetical protein